jgi:hypothetical protein
MHLDMTVTLGNVLQIVLTIGGLFLAYGKLKERLVAIEVQLKPLWHEYTNRRTIVRRAEDRA